MIENTSIKPADDPNRECTKCGKIGDSYAIKRLGKIKYISLCKSCKTAQNKVKIYTECQSCYMEKEPNYRRDCNDCYKDRYLSTRVDIPGEDLLIIKKWVAKQVKFNFMTNMNGINELITNYLLVCRSIYEFDQMKAGKQLDRMWNTLYKMYIDDLKDIPDDVLITMKSDRITKEIINKNKILNIMTNDDIKKIEILFEHTENIKIDGKEYDLRQEYNLCTMGNKTACRRFRKMLAILNIDIKDLRATSLKYANK
jgi:Icc-related predicted phosphoesterase